MTDCRVSVGDCLPKLRRIDIDSVDLVYLDPPFWTRKKHTLKNRERTKEYTFDDCWSSRSDYAAFLFSRLREIHRVLASTGSVFFHCDRRANHLARHLLDQVFGEKQFRAEIIWTYKRWSNSKRSLLPSHQTIYWYSKSDQYVFHRLTDAYSPATNVDQILQRRARDKDGKSIYDRDTSGKVITGPAKTGVPLGDVWDIPYLNPKAKERVGYPTQKPVLLLERIISLVTSKGDLVLDPFCGSGTTLVAAALLG